MHAASNCHCVRSRALRPGVSDALGEPLGRGGAGMCHHQVEKPHFRWRPASSSHGKNTAPGSGVSPECAEMTPTPTPGKDAGQAGMDSF